MTVPEWADEQLSTDLAVLAARGEGPDLEYMECFPENVRDLAKEIAAFATSNQGMILLGVTDSGDIVGIPLASSREGRDQLLRRLEGICGGTIKPAITPTAKFALHDDKIVLVVSIPKGSEPVYYCNSLPYVRHITQARPAEPHEVTELVRKSTSRSSAPRLEADRLSEVLSQVLVILDDILIYGDEARERLVNPWLAQWRSQFAYDGTQLRALALDDELLRAGMAVKLEALAANLDEVASFRMTLGCGDALLSLVASAVSKARQMKAECARLRAPPALSPNRASQVAADAWRRLDQLARRADQLVGRGRTEEFQSEASEIGLELLHWSYSDEGATSSNLGEELKSVGRELHLVETMRLSMDGGRSLQAVVESVRGGLERLKRAANG